MSKSKAYYIDIDRYYTDIVKIAENNELPLGKTLKMLIVLGLNEYNKNLAHFMQKVEGR